MVAVVVVQIYKQKEDNFVYKNIIIKIDFFLLCL